MKKEFKFNIGDRVINLVETDFVKKGATGTVKQEANNPWVKWDSIDMVNDDTDITWAQEEEHLELIPTTKQ